MKQLLVPIDYSTYADNAVHYAIQIARTIKADLHLCHAMVIPELNQAAGLTVWPLETYSTIKQAADERLSDYVGQLKEENNTNDPYFPTLTFSNEIGTVKQIINQLVSDKKIDLVIMGMAGAGKLDRFFLGSNSRNIIEEPPVPILLIPKDSDYLPINKIAFATDLTKSDLNAIQSIARLFSTYHPEILLSHVSPKASDFHDPTTHANQFLNHVTCNINYSKIYYRHIQNDNIEKGLQWLTHNAQIDILSMIHRPAGIFSSIFNGSHTQKLARIVHLPLLVLPENNTEIAW